MSVFLYGGTSGSGKSYQVVTEVIVPQLALGRHIVTTIRGVNVELIRDYLVEGGLAVEKFGTLDVVAGALVDLDTFFPRYDSSSEVFDDSGSTVKNGQLVIIDEAMRYFSAGEKIRPGVRQFLTEHRHSVDAVSKQSSDLVFICPDLTMLHRQIRGVCHTAFVCRKNTEFGGAKSKRFIVAQYMGARRFLKPDRLYFRKYDPRFFAFYQSHAGGVAGDETTVDARQSIFGARFLIAGILLVIVGVGSAVGVWRWFHRGIVSGGRPVVAGGGSVAVRSASGVDGGGSRVSRGVSGISGSLRVVGVVKRGALEFFYVQGADHFVRAVPGSALLFQSGLHVTGRVDGELVTEYSGGVVSVGVASGGESQ